VEHAPLLTWVVRSAAPHYPNPMAHTTVSPLLKSNTRWSRGEEALLKRLSTPEKLQHFLDETEYRPEDDHLPAVRVLRDGRAHCFDGALFSAAVLSRTPISPRIVDLCAVKDDDHLICAYRWKGRWGAVSKSNFPGLRFREPVFRTPRELALSYFESYFNLSREKTLRQYSQPVPLPPIEDLDWECDPTAPDVVLEKLSRARHYDILLPGQARALLSVEKRFFRSQTVGMASR
jgi:hypothetical protein